MRNAYEPIPILATPNPPGVSATSGLGTGGGAGIFSFIPASGSGFVEVVTGSNPSAAGGVNLRFASAPPTLFFSFPEAFGAVTITNQGTTTVSLAWLAAALLPNHRYRFAYEWAVSQ